MLVYHVGYYESQAIQKYKQFLALCITSKNTQGEAKRAETIQSTGGVVVMGT